MDCPICAEPFNKRHRKMVECPTCLFGACHQCVGQFLLSKNQHASCMNCGSGWGYAFLTTQMTKAFLQTEYKDHVKEILFREVEAGLGEYQEVAALIDKKELVRSQLHKIEDDIYFLEDTIRDHLKFNVVFDGRSYQLYMNMSASVPKNRIGAKIISHVHKLVNQPPTDEDKQKMEAERRRLEKDTRRLKLLHMYSVLDLHTFYTDKTLIAWSADIAGIKLSADEKMVCMEKLRDLKIEYEQLCVDMKKFHDAYIGSGDNSDMKSMMDKCRQLSRDFWKHYFKAHPPTSSDFKCIDDDKIKYSNMMTDYRQQIQQNEWDQEDLQDRLNSNTRYIYNLDDCILYPIHNVLCGAQEPSVVSGILATEEARWQRIMKEYDDELMRLAPQFTGFSDEYRTISRELRMKHRNKTVHGRFMLNCSMDGCVGKLDENNQCGMCHAQYCTDCMKNIVGGDGIHTCDKTDIETVKELRKNTRPCPKCHVPIYKVEGCDQMWCVQCHTTFSWKTGAITYGVVHNPHFYEHTRNHANGVRRAPGDIPCGGLPNDAEMFSAFVHTNNALVFDIWDYCVWIAEKHMPSIYRKFNNARNAVIRRHSISYLRNKIDTKRLRVLLYKQYMDEIRYSHYYDLMETLTDNMADQLRQYVNGVNTEKECVALLRIAEQDVSDMNKMFGMKEKFYGSRFTV